MAESNDKPKHKAKPQPKATAKPAEALPAACNVVDCSSGRQQFWKFTGRDAARIVDQGESRDELLG